MSKNNQYQSSQTRDVPFVVTVRIRDEFDLDLAAFDPVAAALEAELAEIESRYESFTTRRSFVNSLGR